MCKNWYALSRIFLSRSLVSCSAMAIDNVRCSVESALSLLDVSLLLLWYVDEVNGTVVRHNCQSVVFKVESNRLEFLIHFDLCKTQVTLPILIKHLHELETTIGKQLVVSMLFNIVFNLPWFCVFGFNLLLQVTVGETELPCLNTLLNSLRDLENVDGLLGGRACQDVLVWMEQDVVNFSFAITSLEFLDDLASIGAINFDNMTSFRSGCNKRSIWIDSDGADLSVVSWNDQVNGLVND